MNNAFRKATAADSAALMELVRDCVAAMRAAGIEQWDEIYPGADNISADIEAGTLEVMSEGGVIAGCLTLDRNMDPMWQSMDWSSDGEPAGAVHRLMVHPSRQGCGFGKLLMQHAEAAAEQQGWRSIR